VVNRHDDQGKAPIRIKNRISHTSFYGAFPFFVAALR
jgi:hypothetical protein